MVGGKASGSSARGRSSLPELLFAGLVLALAVAAGLAWIERWVAPGNVPYARGWFDTAPLALLAGAAAIGAAALLRRASIALVAMGGLAWAFGVLVITELPIAVTSFRVGDGPMLVSVYLAAAVAAGLYAVAGPRAHAPPVRIAALIAFLGSANGRLFARDEDAVFALLLAAATLGLACAERRYTLAGLLRGPGRALAVVIVAFLAWTLVASLVGASPTHSASIWANLLLGALVAWTLAGALSARDVARVFAALIAGLGVALVVLVVGTVEASTVLGTGWLRSTRLRLFDLHPGLIAPFLAVGVCLALARIVAYRARPRTAATSAALLLALGVALAMNQARASLLGAAVGVAVFTLSHARRLPHRPLPLGIAALAAVVLGVGFLVSPLGAPVRAKLEAKTFTSSALGQRYHYWQMAGDAVRRDPVLGQGLRSEWARTDLARPSYLDDGDQGLHAHNLLFSVAEAAGVPAALLFLLLVLGVLEAGRRAVLAQQDPSRRALAAGVLAAAAAHLTANLLSMGQARLTVVPLFLWIALGLFAAFLADEDGADVEREHAGLPRVALAAVVLLLFSASPIAGGILVRRGRAQLAQGDADAAVRLFDTALTVNPLDQGVHMDLSRAELARGDTDAAISAIEAACASAPKQAAWQFTRGSALLSAGRADEAAGAFELAVSLNPLGRLTGDVYAAWAWALLRQSDVDGARAKLAEAIRRGSNYWKQIPKIKMPAKPGDPPDAARLGFLVGDPRTSSFALPLDEILAILGDEMRAALGEDPPDLTRARRLFGYVVEVYRDERVLAEPFALVDAFTAAVPDRFSSTDAVYSRLLLDAGRFEDADAVAARARGVRSHVPKQEILRYLFTRSRVDDDPALIERAQEIAADTGMIDKDDVWFARGLSAEQYGFLAELALRRGDLNALERYHAAQVFDLPDPATRANACRQLVGLMLALDSEVDVLADEIAHCVYQQSCIGGPGREQAADAFAHELAEAWRGEGAAAAAKVAAVEERLGCADALGERFGLELRAKLGL